MFFIVLTACLSLPNPADAKLTRSAVRQHRVDRDLDRQDFRKERRSNKHELRGEMQENHLAIREADTPAERREIRHDIRD
jgi:hypothetical protein